MALHNNLARWREYRAADVHAESLGASNLEKWFLLCNSLDYFKISFKVIQKGNLLNRNTVLILWKCYRKWPIPRPILPKGWGDVCTFWRPRFHKFSKRFSSIFCANIGSKIKHKDCFVRWQNFVKMWIRRLRTLPCFWNARTHGRMHGGQIFFPN